MHPDPSTKTRTLVKAFVWEIISFFITLGISSAFLDAYKATWLTGMLFAVKVSFLYCYERAWHKIRWGKIKP